GRGGARPGEAARRADAVHGLGDGRSEPPLVPLVLFCAARSRRRPRENREIRLLLQALAIERQMTSEESRARPSWTELLARVRPDARSRPGQGGSTMLTRFRSMSLVNAFGALLLAAPSAPGQAVVTRVTVPQPWRAANAVSNGAWSPERNGMAISADGRWVVFESAATNIAPYDKNPNGDIFVFEVATGRIVGITSTRNITANGASYDPAI